MGMTIDQSAFVYHPFLPKWSSYMFAAALSFIFCNQMKSTSKLLGSILPNQNELRTFVTTCLNLFCYLSQIWPKCTWGLFRTLDSWEKLVQKSLPWLRAVDVGGGGGRSPTLLVICPTFVPISSHHQTRENWESWNLMFELSILCFIIPSDKPSLGKQVPKTLQLGSFLL